jgi:hypothetical protein
MGTIEVKIPDLADPSNLAHCGMAILISPRVALTCAHVVKRTASIRGGCVCRNSVSWERPHDLPHRASWQSRL